MSTTDAATTDFLHTDDFKSIELKISLMNSTTRTEIRDGKRFFGGTVQTTTDDLSIRLVELLEHDLVLEAPENACAVGHNLVLHIQTENNRLNISVSDPRFRDPKMPDGFSLSATAKVKKVETPEKGRSTVTVSLVQYDEESFKMFYGLFSNRQSEIEAFFNAVKGE